MSYLRNQVGRAVQAAGWPAALLIAVPVVAGWLNFAPVVGNEVPPLSLARCVPALPAKAAPPQVDAGAAELKPLPGFRAEVVYRVPRSQGSWVCLTADPRGRLVASDQ